MACDDLSLYSRHTGLVILSYTFLRPEGAGRLLFLPRTRQSDDLETPKETNSGVYDGRLEIRARLTDSLRDDGEGARVYPLNNCRVDRSSDAGRKA